ncbi:hypothetical protein R83H12_00546 [Fibrobacteria bacterium R8-3-H12]
MKTHIKSVLFALLLAFLPIYGQQKVTIVNTEDDGTPPLGYNELTYITDRLHEIALKNLSQKDYSILTMESIVAALGSYEAISKKLKDLDGSLAKFGWELKTDYIGRASIGRLGKELTIKVEFYDTKTRELKSKFTAQAKNMYDLASILDKEAPSLFNKIQNIETQSLIQPVNNFPMSYESGDALMFYKQGISYQDKGDYDKAIKNYDKALNLIIKKQMKEQIKEKPKVKNMISVTPKPKNGVVPLSVIPAEIRDEFENSMPIFSGTNPPDISGQYIATPLVLTGSSRSSDILGTQYADLYFAFINYNGNLSYREKSTASFGVGDNVRVEIVGSDNSFTAYLVSIGESEGIPTNRSVVISGTITTDGISNFYYGFIMLGKGDDPYNKVVEVHTYRTFKDSDGLAVRYEWLGE